MASSTTTINGKDYFVGVDRGSNFGHTLTDPQDKAAEREELDRHKDVLVPPSPEQIDGHIAEYEARKAAADQAQEFADDAKKILVFLADNFGQRPAGSEQSLRISGVRNVATVTRSTTVVVNESAVVDLQKETCDIPAIFPRLFAARTKHTLIEGARDALKALVLSRRRHEKVLALFGKCFDVKTNAPSLKVEVIKPEKPAKKPRGPKSGTGKDAA